jgi:phage tail-like protein
VDANGTRFHLLLGADWKQRTSAGRPPLSPPSGADPIDGVVFDDLRGEVTLRPLPFAFPDVPGNRIPSLDDRRGAARDRYGNWYWIADTSTAVLVRSAGSRQTTVFWQTGLVTVCELERRSGDFAPLAGAEPLSPAPLQLRALAVTEDHHLVVGVVDPPGLLVFDLHAGGPPYQLCWPRGVEFAPFDMTPRKKGGVWVLDRDHARIWGFDRHFGVIRREPPPPQGVVAETFGPVEGSPPAGTIVACRADVIRRTDAWPAVQNAIAIEAYQGDALLLLDLPPSGPSTLYYLPRIDAPMQPFDLSLLHSGLRGHDVAVAHGTQREKEDPRGLRVFVVAASGNQSIAFTLEVDASGTATLKRRNEYYPMRLYGGKGLVAAGGDAYYDLGDSWIALVEQLRPVFVKAGTLLLNEPLDGKDPDCVWHRLLLDACIPPETAIEVWTRASNEPSTLATASWIREPRPYLRQAGSELPFLPLRPRDNDGTWELLFQRASGRYFEMKLTFRSNGRVTPRLRALRAYYPRFSYRDKYLPAVYRQEPDPASFLDRFLANMEGTLTAIEDRIAAAQMLFDVRTAPAETLDWLASWFEVALDPLWSERKRRLFIRHAVELFERRGTVRGLQLALALTLFNCETDDLFDARPGQSPAARIRILEKFVTRPRHGRGWTPDRRRDDLRRRYEEFLRSQNATAAAGHFPLVPPGDAGGAALWRRFSLDTLGWVPAIGSVAAAAWREFLARRYHSVAGFNEVYRLTGHAPIATFEDLTPPQAAPPDGAPLTDWYEFEVVSLATAAAAHRFTVLLPVSRATQADSLEHRRLRELTDRIVALEKPAHTVFDVRFYWALFRVGEVRLGPDAVLGLGSRAPDALLPMVLDRGHLAENYLAPSHPRNVTERRPVAGRDRPGCGSC